MSEYRITFGCRYAREPHPTFGAAHPDGWLTILAPDEETARRAAHGWCGGQWAFIYDDQSVAEIDERAGNERSLSWDQLFPRGELHRIEVPS